MDDTDHSLPAPGSVAAILPAAGSGQRFGAAGNKLFELLGDKPIWFHSASRLAARPEIGSVVMMVAESDLEVFDRDHRSMIDQLGLQLVRGGETRTDSVRAGLDAIAEDSAIEYVAIHDAARPLISDGDIGAVLAAAAQSGAAILATPVSSTIKRDLGHGKKSETVDRRELWVALTPQVFRVGLLKQAYQKHNGRPATDDAQLVERIGHDVALVHGSADNLKITFPEDLIVAEAILSRRSSHA